MVTMTVTVTAQGVPCPRPCRGEAAPSFRALPSLPAPLSYFSAAAFPPSLRHVRVGLELSRAAPAPGWALSWALSCSHIPTLPIPALPLLPVPAGPCGRIHGNETRRERGQKGPAVSALPRDSKCRAGRAPLGIPRDLQLPSGTRDSSRDTVQALPGALRWPCLAAAAGSVPVPVPVPSVTVSGSRGISCCHSVPQPGPGCSSSLFWEQLTPFSLSA